MIRWSPLGGWLALGIAQVSIAAAQARPPRDSLPQPLGEIVVSADHPVAEATATLRQRDSADLRALGARTLNDGIVLLPGLHTRLAAEGVVRLDLRGYRTRHVQLLLDGVPVNSSLDGQFDPTTIPVELIDRVKVTTGVPSVLYGQGGLGGVINVVTRPAEIRPSVAAQAEVREGGGQLARATASGRRAGVGAFLGLSALEQDAFRSWNGSPTLGPVESAPRSNAAFRRRSLFGSASTGLGAGWRIGLEGNWIGARGGAPPSLIDQPSDSFAQRPRFERLDHSDGGRLQLATDGAVTSRLSLRGWAFRNWLAETTSRFADSLYQPGSVPGTAGTARTDDDGATRGTAARLTWRTAGRLALALGAEGDRWNGLEIATSGGGANRPPRTDTTRSVARLARYRVAVEYQSPEWRGFQAGAGLLREWQRGSGTEASGTGLTAGATYRPGSRVSLRLAFGRLFRFPNAQQLFSVDGGNPALDAEVSRRVELGADLRPTDGLGVSVAVFDDRARNFIERPSPDSAFANREASRFRGVEVEGTWREGSTLLRAGWSWLDAVDRSPGRSGARLPYRPRHKVTAEVRHGWSFGLDAALSVRYVAGQVYDSRRGPARTRRLGDYALVGLRVGQRLPVHGVGLYLGADNLFDHAYEEAYGFPEAGRTAYLGLEARI